MRNFKVYIDGKEYEVTVEEIGGSEQVAPVVTEIKPVETKSAAPALKKAVATGGNAVKAPMPGMVKEFKVADGATVVKGQIIYILEAMKMDNEIASEFNGKISFKVSKGSNVETDEVVATIE